MIKYQHIKILENLFVFFYFAISVQTMRQKIVCVSIGKSKLDVIKLICFSVCFIKQINVTQELSEE